MEIEYQFRNKNEIQLTYTVTEKSESKALNKEDFPSWVHLEYQKCSNCPLDSDKTPLCPVALELHDVLEACKEKLSFEASEVIVKTEEREYRKKTDFQSGLFSLLGLMMAKCNCPHFFFLKPLARFHLPFSTVEETLFRISSSHILKKYISNKSDSTIKVDLSELVLNYSELETVNGFLLERVKDMSKGDANKNAIVALNIFAQIFSMKFENELEFLDDLIPS